MEAGRDKLPRYEIKRASNSAVNLLGLEYPGEWAIVLLFFFLAFCIVSIISSNLIILAFIATAILISIILIYKRGKPSGCLVDSLRYSILDKEFYLPSTENLAAQSTSNRQGRGEVLEGDQAKEVLELLKNDSERTYDNYETMLNERFDGSTIDENKKGLARELARMNLTLNTYTQWYWKTDLLNLMNFLRLRADSHAQYEIRVYADIMLDTVKKWVPITYDAFMDYRVGGTEVSAKGKAIIQKLIKGEDVNPDSSGLSKREWNELMVSFDLKDKLI